MFRIDRITNMVSKSSVREEPKDLNLVQKLEPSLGDQDSSSSEGDGLDANADGVRAPKKATVSQKLRLISAAEAQAK